MTEENKSVKNFPNLRFPGFEDSWEERKLEELIQIQSGFAFKSEYFIDNGNKLVIPKNFTKYGYGNFDDNISKFSQEQPPKQYKCKEGDLLILLTDLTPSCELLGKPLLLKKEDGEVWLNQRIIKLLIEDLKLKNWLFYYFQTEDYLKIIKETSTGSTVRHSSNKIINQLQIFIPNNPEEQQKISSLITLVDSRIQTQKKIIEQLETLMRANREKLFSQKLRFKDEHGSDFPAWERKKIKKILTIGSGKDYKHLNYGAIPVYGTGGVITFVDSFLYDGETVCIGRKGTIDKPLYFNGKIWTVDTLFYTHSFNNSVPKFVFNIFQNINWKEYNEASGVPSLSKNTIEKIVISIPCIEEQTKIANFLSSIQEKIETEKQILEKLELHKKFLLANLFV
ncbi:restriction endonuclease subunit S [Elizabethkingia anophelis]|nr:restriction endonuclease subunit S [Elizabethkingia anophelis]MCT4208808.1 restriction endonuclease subunit S [Elizabethkingia anophelis]